LTLLVLAAGPELTAAEQALREAGIATDGPGLLAFFRTRTLTPADRERLQRAVEQLGDDSFTVREKAVADLTAVGRSALPLLAPALKSTDPEVVRLAKECIATIERVPHTTVMAAAGRALAERRPAGAVEALLAYLPQADDPLVEQSLRESLVLCGLADGAPVPALAAAAAHRETACRLAAAFVLGRATSGHAELLARLRTDTSPLVRCTAAESLLRHGDRQAVPVLLGLLSDGPAETAWRADDLLRRIARDRAPAVYLGAADDKSRRACRAAWDGWWQKHGQALDAAALRVRDVALGWVVTCQDEEAGDGPGHLRAYDRAGKLCCHFDGLNSPADVHLLDAGRVLIAEHWVRRVTERDLTGKVIWKQELDDKPVSCQRLANGNTFIATYTELLEVTRDGKKLYSYNPSSSMIYAAQKLPSGNLLWINMNGKVGELSPDGKEVLSFTPEKYADGAPMWASVEFLAKDRYLISFSGTNRVLETDAKGKIQWEAESASPTWATRLPNGNTLVTGIDGRCVRELDPTGKEVWKQTTPGRPFRARRY
jgi:HEAT repeat protein